MKKYKYILLLLICICFVDLVFASNKSLKGKKIYLDAGHGGIDPGAVNKDVKEKDINLLLTLKLKEALEKNGAQVYMTRTEDIDLADTNAKYRKRSDLGNRAKIINNSDCNLYLSIHLNSLESKKWAGAQVFYDDINDKNIKLAEYLQKQFQNDLNTNRVEKKIANKYMYKRIEKTGVLLELGFLSNDNERHLLQQDEYQNKIVNSIKDGIVKYIYNE